MDIRRNIIRCNNSGRRGAKIKYLVIHDTGNTSRGAGAYNHYKYFDGGNRRASAHYFVDDKEIIQTVDDSRASWHCGDGKGKNGITNRNSIGVELCVNSDGNYDKTFTKAVELVKHLMRKYNINIDRVVRHFDVGGKICPCSMSKNGWQKWYEFIQRVKECEKFYRVMAGSYSNIENANRQIDKLKKSGFDACMLIFEKTE